MLYGHFVRQHKVAVVTGTCYFVKMVKSNFSHSHTHTDDEIWLLLSDPDSENLIFIGLLSSSCPGWQDQPHSETCECFRSFKPHLNQDLYPLMDMPHEGRQSLSIR